MKKRMYQRAARLVLVLTMLLTLVPLGKVRAQSEAEPQSGLPTVEEQIRAYADSIDQNDAVDAAASALALHGITMGGRTLHMDEDNALTAVLMNSGMGFQSTVDACLSGIRMLQQVNRSSIYVNVGLNWSVADIYYVMNVFFG